MNGWFYDQLLYFKTSREHALIHDHKIGPFNELAIISKTKITGYGYIKMGHIICNSRKIKDLQFDGPKYQVLISCS